MSIDIYLVKYERNANGMLVNETSTLLSHARINDYVVNLLKTADVFETITILEDEESGKTYELSQFINNSKLLIAIDQLENDKIFPEQLGWCRNALRILRLKLQEHSNNHNVLVHIVGNSHNSINDLV